MRIFNSYNFTNGIALEFINSCNFLTGNLSEFVILITLQMELY